MGSLAIGDDVRVSGHIGAGIVGAIGRATGPSVRLERGELIAVEHAIEAKSLLSTVGT